MPSFATLPPSDSRRVPPRDLCSQPLVAPNQISCVPLSTTTLSAHATCPLSQRAIKGFASSSLFMKAALGRTRRASPGTLVEPSPSSLWQASSLATLLSRIGLRSFCRCQRSTRAREPSAISCAGSDTGGDSAAVSEGVTSVMTMRVEGARSEGNLNHSFTSPASVACTKAT